MFHSHIFLLRVYAIFEISTLTGACFCSIIFLIILHWFVYFNINSVIASLKGYKDIVTLLAPHSDVNRLCNIPVTKKQIDSKRQEDNDITYDESGIDTTPNDSNNNMNSHKKTITVQMSALVAAVKKNHVDIIYTLLYCGANPNQTDHRGYTALSHAAQYGHLEIVEILVTHGADVRVRSKGGKLPIHKAKKNKHFHVVEYLEKCAP